MASIIHCMLTSLKRRILKHQKAALRGGFLMVCFKALSGNRYLLNIYFQQFGLLGLQ